MEALYACGANLGWNSASALLLLLRSCCLLLEVVGGIANDFISSFPFLSGDGDVAVSVDGPHIVELMNEPLELSKYPAPQRYGIEVGEGLLVGGCGVHKFAF